MRVEDYAKTNLHDEITIIENSDRINSCPEINIYEKAVIYKYSDDGFEQVNDDLRKSRGKKVSEFAVLLEDALSKLPSYEGLVYRKVYLTPAELNRYKKALNGKNIVEYPFVSTTKSRLIAMNFVGTTYTPNCLFRIQSKTGKDIEKIARFGEQEVLISRNASFNVLEVRRENDYTLITMEEI